MKARRGSLATLWALCRQTVNDEENTIFEPDKPREAMQQPVQRVPDL
jgi:hypothetical protein